MRRDVCPPSTHRAFLTQRPRVRSIEAEILFLKHESSILGQWSNTVSGSRKSQFSMGQTGLSLTCSIMEKPHTGLDDCLKMLLSCFRKRMSGRPPTVLKMNRDHVHKVQSRSTAAGANKHPSFAHDATPPPPHTPSCQCDQERQISRSLSSLKLIFETLVLFFGI